MKRLIVTSTAALLMAGTALANPPEIGEAVGTSFPQVEADLDARGFELIEFLATEGRITFEAVDADQRVEAVLDAETGAVAEIAVYPRRGAVQRAGVMTPEALRSLTDQGYVILGYERYRNEFEVYARRDGQVWELRLNPATGDVVSRERES